MKTKEAPGHQASTGTPGTTVLYAGRDAGLACGSKTKKFAILINRNKSGKNLLRENKNNAYFWIAVKGSYGCCWLFSYTTSKRNERSAAGDKPLAETIGTLTISEKPFEGRGIIESPCLLVGNRERPDTVFYGIRIHGVGTFEFISDARPEGTSSNPRFHRLGHEVFGRLAEHLWAEFSAGDSQDLLIVRSPLGRYAPNPVLYVRDHCFLDANRQSELPTRKPLFFALQFDKFSDFHTYSIHRK